MFDQAIQPIQHRLLQRPARALARRGVRADTVTLVGFVVGVLAVPLIAAGLYLPALGVILCNRVLDGLDGAVARETRITDRGAFADIAFDFAFYALVPLGFAFADPAANALAAAVLVTSFVGTGSSFLAFAIIAARRGLRSARYPSKGIHYLGGLTEGTETIAAFVLVCLFPAWFPIVASVFSVLCWITTLARWREGWVAFTDR